MVGVQKNTKMIIETLVKKLANFFGDRKNKYMKNFFLDSLAIYLLLFVILSKGNCFIGNIISILSYILCYIFYRYCRFFGRIYKKKIKGNRYFDDLHTDGTYFYEAKFKACLLLTVCFTILAVAFMFYSKIL